MGAWSGGWGDTAGGPVSAPAPAGRVGDTVGGPLEQVVGQLDVLSQTMSLLEQRLSVAEVKGASMEHILAQVRRDPIVSPLEQGSRL
eukprot:scaffold34908_cov51-Isochrysis_galbana.AAC.1